MADRRTQPPEDVIDPDAGGRTGPYVGWLGPNPPEGPYQACPASYRNRERHLEESEVQPITVVCNDRDRREVFENALEAYRVDPPALDLSVHENVPRAELARILETERGFVHFIGPARDGLGCTDGSLPIDDLEELSIEAFFLDGPGSRDTGFELLRAGCVAGAVWTDAIRSPPASSGGRSAYFDTIAAVRRRFLTGLVGGFTIDLARRYAFRNVNGRVPLAVVGDGLFELGGFGQIQVFPIEIEPIGHRRFLVTIPTRYADAGIAFGGLALERWQLGGNPFELTLEWSDIAQLLDTRWYLIVYEGELYRPDECDPFYPVV